MQIWRYSMYAVKIMISKDDWIFVTKSTSNCWDLQPETFSTRNAAEKFAKIFSAKYKNKQITKVVKYGQE